MALLSVGITPLTLRVREQSEVVEQLTTKADFVPVLRQQLAVLKREQERSGNSSWIVCWHLVAGTSELQTFLAELNDLARLHNVAITTTKPGVTERFKARKTQGSGADCTTRSRWSGGSKSRAGDPLLNRGLEKRSAALTVTGPVQAGAGVSAIAGTIGSVCGDQ